MASRKDLKKHVSGVMSQLFSECVATKLYVKDVNQAQADEILADIVWAETDFTARINHTEPGCGAKNFYKKFRSDFENKVDELCAHIDALSAAGL